MSMNIDRPAAVRLDHVSYRRSGREPSVLSGICLSIEAGQWVCIAGSNGSGKSTLIKLMDGLLPVCEGKVIIDGLVLGPETLWDIRAKIGIVFANPDDQFVGMTVADDIAFGLENRMLERIAIEERLRYYAELLDVTHLLNRHPAALSGGQKQRVAIASVLAMEPSIVIFDEAASMLDERSKRELLETMRKMRRSGRYTLISVTHDTEEMAAADRMIVLADGAVAADGNPDELLKREELLRQCRLQTPYPLQLCMELKRRGVDIGEHVGEEEVLAALWAYRSRACRTVIPTEA